MNNKKSSGLGTSPEMWKRLSNRLAEIDLSTPVKNAIKALGEGKAIIVKRTTQALRRPRTQYQSDTSDIGLSDS